MSNVTTLLFFYDCFSCWHNFIAFSRPRSHGGTPQNRSFEYDDTENLNPEEIINSWKKTVSEIEEYKSDGFYDKMSDKIIRESPSRTIGSRHNSLDGRFENLVDRLELDSSADSSPTKRSPSDYSNIKFPRNVSLSVVGFFFLIM